MTGARAVPIYQTTSFVFENSDHAARFVRAAAVRQHLHPHHESDDRRAREAGRVARERRGGAGDCERTGGAVARDQQPDGIGRRDGFREHALRRHVHAVRCQLPPARVRRRNSSSRTIPENFRKAITPKTKLHLRRDDQQSARQRPRYRSGREDRARAQHSAGDRQHVRDAVSVPADRLRRRHRGPLADEVHGRPRHQHRRHHRRQRQVSMGEGQLPDAERALRPPITG